MAYFKTERWVKHKDQSSVVFEKKILKYNLKLYNIYKYLQLQKKQLKNLTDTQTIMKMMTMIKEPLKKEFCFVAIKRTTWPVYLNEGKGVKDCFE